MSRFRIPITYDRQMSVSLNVWVVSEEKVRTSQSPISSAGCTSTKSPITMLSTFIGGNRAPVPRALTPDQNRRRKLPALGIPANCASRSHLRASFRSKSMPLAGGSEVRRSIVGASLVSSNDSPFGPFVVGGVEAFGSVLRSSAARPAAAEAAVSPSGEASVGAEAPPNVAALSFAGRFDVAPPGVRNWPKC